MLHVIAYDIGTTCVKTGLDLRRRDGGTGG